MNAATRVDDSPRPVEADGRPSDSFDILYRSCAPKILGYLKAHGVEDPEAATHDVFVTLLSRHEAATGGPDGLRTLLFTIAHSRCVDHHRRRTRRPETVEYDVDFDRRCTPSAEDTVVQKVSSTKLAGILADLNNDQREALTLRVIADFSLEQVAHVMGKSVGAVKQLQRRALLNVKKHPQLHTWRA